MVGWGFCRGSERTVRECRCCLLVHGLTLEMLVFEVLSALRLSPYSKINAVDRGIFFQPHDSSKSHLLLILGTDASARSLTSAFSYLHISRVDARAAATGELTRLGTGR